MKQELLNSDKELLLKDLCARLPYGVKCNISKKNETCVKSRTRDSILDCHWLSECKSDFYEIKPYLFPLSSMTEEQRNELKSLLRPLVLKSLDEEYEDIEFPTLISTNPSVVEIDYYNMNHFDYRGLIEKGLAIDCTNLNIY